MTLDSNNGTRRLAGRKDRSMQSLPRTLAATAVAALALGLAACGGGGSSSSNAGQVPSSQDLGGKKGGTLKVISSGDVDYIDPGAAYYQFSYMVLYPMQRPLYSFAPDDTTKPTPDFADGEPQVSSDNKTVTIKTKSGIKFSPPVNRAATSKDVKYAIERGFKSSVANGYAGAYFGSIEGATAYQDGKASSITGIQTPNDSTIVFKLTKPLAGPLIGALTLPLSAPVPQEYAAKYDSQSPSTYGQHQVSTGPYMLKDYEPGKSITMTRNPNWNASTDYRKAYLDEVDVDEGNNDTTVASRQILDGQAQVNGDFIPPPPVLKKALDSTPDQVLNPPSGGNRYVAMNTTIKPFDNINVRKAVIAVFDRTAMRLTRGGAVIGDIATHYIPPGMPGFDQAGGVKGPGYDFLANPDGDLQLAESYMKKAGYPSGKYTGGQTLLMVGTSGGTAQKSAEVAQAQFQKLGFKLNFRLVQQDTMYTKFCNVPKAAVAICPNVGWQKDFPDGQTILDPTFNGQNIVQENNSNWPQLNDPKINQAMDQAAQVVGVDARGNAWGKIDREVSAQAPAVPWVWDNQPNIRSTNVKGVINKALAQWDLDFTSLQ